MNCGRSVHDLRTTRDANTGHLLSKHGQHVRLWAICKVKATIQLTLVKANLQLHSNSGTNVSDDPTSCCAFPTQIFT